MCVAVPGRVVEVAPNALGMTMGTVDFGEVRRTVSLAYVPEVEVGDFVMVHMGFALGIVDEDEARETLDILRRVDGAAAVDGVAGPPG